jgi:hypothetical protein
MIDTLLIYTYEHWKGLITVSGTSDGISTPSPYFQKPFARERKEKEIKTNKLLLPLLKKWNSTAIDLFEAPPTKDQLHTFHSKQWEEQTILQQFIDHRELKRA